MDIVALTVSDTDVYETCTELHSEYPNYACFDDYYKDKCCGTCLAKNTAPCRFDCCDLSKFLSTRKIDQLTDGGMDKGACVVA